MKTLTARAERVDAGDRQAARPPAAPRRRRLWRRRPDVGALLFLLPTVLIFGYFAWWPIARSLTISFQHTDLVRPAEWVGLQNFRDLFADPLLGTAVVNSLWFAGWALVLGFPLPLFLAVVMSSMRRAGTLFRVLVYLPVIMPPVVALLLWKWFYEPDYGLFNDILGLVGLGPYPWLQSTTTAMPSLVIADTWHAFGTTVLIYVAAVTGVPKELYEAAEIDGASILRRIWHVTLPRLRSVVLLLMLLQIISTLQVFAQPFVMTDGGPNDGTITVLMLIYQYAFKYGDYGMAAALSMVLAVVLAVVSAVYLRLTRSWSTE